MARWKGQTRGGTAGYLFFIYMIRYLGIGAAYGFLSLVVLYFIPFAPKATAATWRYARQTLGRNRWKSACLLLRNYYRLGQILIDKVAIGNGMVSKYHFEFEQYPRFLEVLNSGQGVIMIGAHVGNWEIGAPFFDDYGKKINIVMYDAEHQRIKELLEKSDRPYKVIPVNEDNLTHVFRITEALRQKEYVCFQGDRYLNQEKLLTCTFMGRAAAFPAGPFLLASRLKVPVVFYFAMREKGRTYRFYFAVADEAVRSRSAKPEQAQPKNGQTQLKPGQAQPKPEQVLLEQYVAALEGIVNRYPEQWFNYYPFWQLPQTTVSN